MGLISLTPFPPEYDQVIRSYGPASYWRLNESSGTTAANQVSGGNTLSYTSTTLGQAGAVVGGKSVLMNGTSSYIISAINPAFLNITGTALTMTCWVFPLASGNYQTLMSYSNSQGTNNRQYAMFLGQVTSNIYVDIFNGTNGPPGNVAISTAWAVNAWNHIVVTYNGTNATVYLNGKSVGSAAAPSAIVANTNPAMFVGTETSTGISSPTPVLVLDGRIAEAAVFAKVLTAGQIVKLYNSRG
jgi:Concanavalin A-like lectin/glucanases superfamily